ncbi:abortive infection family protein [Propionibacterium freudenreichii]|uniref:abortive infection family protein n=1 Tax=Propionibacterium freudenreichii TaxID=1744 RepID=UPI0024864BD3|nr:abortive infection family protein [Propionibacterium freudenreichii]WGU89514.1 abortive infection family protein [Propionibacterium freudenreichii]
MDLIELGAVIGDFFEDGKGPSHDQLDQAFVRAGLTLGDPAPGGRTPVGTPLGKTKRIRAVFVYATDHDPAAGLRLGQQIVALLRADGAFSPSLDNFAGADRVTRLRTTFERLGFTLDTDGALRPTVLDNLSGTELTVALRAYVNRINLNPQDAPLQIGTGKDLDEATARHVLEQKIGSYPVGGREGSFPVTLARAFTAVGFSVPPKAKLDSDPHKAVQQCLFLLSMEVNRLRNDAGTGHGHPSGPRKTQPLTPTEGRLVARATALVATALLDTL